MGMVRYRSNRRGIRDLLGGEWVRADLARRADRVAAAARRSYKAKPPHSGTVEVLVSSSAGETGARIRSRAAVIAMHPAALHIEADRRVLGRALDAAKPKPRKPRKKSTAGKKPSASKRSDE